METERRAQRCRQAAALLPPRLRREVPQPRLKVSAA